MNIEIAEGPAVLQHPPIDLRDWELSCFRLALAVVQDVAVLIAVHQHLSPVPRVVPGVFLVGCVDALPVVNRWFLTKPREIEIYYKPVSQISSEVHPDSEL